MKDFIIAVSSSAITIFIGFLINRRKALAETKKASTEADLNEIKTVKEIIEIYKEGFERLEKELQEARKEISTLRKEVKDLSDLNHKLDTELKSLKKLQIKANENPQK